MQKCMKCATLKSIFYSKKEEIAPQIHIKLINKYKSDFEITFWQLNVENFLFWDDEKLKLNDAFQEKNLVPLTRKI